MLKKLDYSIRLWEKEKEIELKYVKKNPNYITNDLELTLKRLYDNKINVINIYDSLRSNYYHLAMQYYFLFEDSEAFKGYLYLSAKAIEMCYQLYEKGIKSVESINSKLENNLVGRTNADCALLAGDIELALRLATRKSAIGNMILKNYEEAKVYVESENSNKNFQAMQISVINADEIRLKEYIEERIRIVRKEARFGVTTIDRFGLTILKLAKMRGMSCDIHVAELPLVLLEDTPIDYKKWRLPIPEHVKKILDE